MSALNWMVSGALPSSVSESAQASKGAAISSSSSPSPLAPAMVVGGVAGGARVGAGAGAAGAAVVAVDLGVSPVGAPPPQPARASVTIMPSEAEQPSIRIVVPPGPDVGKRPRILTDPSQAVNVRRGSRGAGIASRAVLAAALLCVLAPAARAIPTRGDLPVLVVLAVFHDRALGVDRDMFPPV